MKKAQIIAPVGSGKTLMQHEAAWTALQDGASVIVVLAPRISLVHQLMDEFWSYKHPGATWDMICVCSSKAEVKELYEDEEADLSIETTTSPNVIETRIHNTINDRRQLIMFGTYHSALKIKKALNDCGKRSDLVIFDEAHNLTQKEWSEYAKSFPCDAQLFFTATRKINSNSAGIGRGMDNSALFGEVIWSITPNEIIKRGKIVQPRIHLVKPKQDLNLSKEKDDIKGQLMSVIAGAVRHDEETAGESRIIVFCKSAPDAHAIAESDAIKTYLPDWYSCAVTSNGITDGGQPSNTKRKEVFGNFLAKSKSILFHYDVVSEGVNLPGATAILPLRALGEIKMIQAVGRVLRVDDFDRAALADGRITVEDKSSWKKPYGWVILPILGQNYDESAEALKETVYALRSANFDYDVEKMSLVDNPKGHEPKEPEFDNGDEPELQLGLFSGLTKQLKDVHKKVTHDIEALSTVKASESVIDIELGNDSDSDMELFG